MTSCLTPVTVVGLVGLSGYAVFRLLSGNIAAEPLPLIAAATTWVVTVTTVLYAYAVLMEVFMAHYSGMLVNDREVATTWWRQIAAAALLRLAAASVCIPFVRENAWAMLLVSALAFAGMVWEARLVREFQ